MANAPRLGSPASTFSILLSRCSHLYTVGVALGAAGVDKVNFESPQVLVRYQPAPVTKASTLLLDASRSTDYDGGSIVQYTWQAGYRENSKVTLNVTAGSSTSGASGSGRRLQSSLAANASATVSIDSDTSIGVHQFSLIVADDVGSEDWLDLTLVIVTCDDGT